MPIIQRYLERGTFHPVYSEDFQVQTHTGGFKIFGVFDGCSAGKASHFASALLGKLLRKASLMATYPSALPAYGISSDQALDSVDYVRFVLAKILFQELRRCRKDLMLDKEEMLATLVLAVMNPDMDQVALLVAGDGFFSLNGHLTKIDQEDRPNYPAYHLNRPFEQWYEEETFQLEASDVTQFAISTDGADTFCDARHNPPPGPSTAEYLLAHPFGAQDSLQSRVGELVQQGYRPQDDVAMYRIEWD